MSACIDENQATALLQGALDEPAIDALDAHVDGCAECWTLLSTLATAEAPDRGPDEPRGRFGRGMTLGRYVLSEIAGVGGMSAVYAAYDPELDRTVAIKLVHPSVGGPATAALIAREASAMARLRHPNVVTVFDVGTFDEGMFLAMEFVAGTTLSAWLAGEARTSAEILSVFVDAGRGLAAAHRADIVHRDFKPDNVLVGDWGDERRRVVVTDFGLALARGAASSGLSGTPKFMAPEQRAGARTIDGRADQYAFCIALRDALDASRAARLSRRIERVIARGLADAPENRWPTMDALLDELVRPPRVTAKRVAVVSAMVFALAASLVVLLRGRVEQYRDHQRRMRALDAAWNPSENAAVQRAMLDVGVPFAAEEWSRVERALNRYVATARTASIDLRGARVTDDVRALRASCLDVRVAGARGLVGLLKKADAEGVRRATASVYALERVEDCADDAKLVRGESSQLDPETATSLALARVMDVHGKYAEGARLTEEIVQSAIRRGDRRAESRALVLWGELSLHAGDAKGGEERLVRGERLAESIGADRTRAHALISLMHVAGTLNRDRARTLELDERVRLILQRIGGDDNYEAHRLALRGSSESAMGNYEAAVPLLVQSLEVQKRVFGAKTSEVAMALNNLGFTATESGDSRLGRESLEEAIAIWTETYGPRYPSLTLAFDNLGQIYDDEGDRERAFASYKRGLAIAEESLGPNHRMVAMSLNSVGDSLTRSGRANEALPLHLRALSILEGVLGKGHRRTQESLQFIGMAQFALGARASAIDALSRAEALGEVGPPRFRARAKFTLARALTDDAKGTASDRAIAQATGALEILRRGKRHDVETETAVTTWLERYGRSGAK